MFKKLTSFLFALAVVPVVYAQHNTSSPYSRYGYGELVDGGFGLTRSIGGQTAAVRNSSHINSGNPASYDAIDSLGFRFEFGASVKYSAFSDENNTQHSWDENIDYLAMQFPITHWMGFSVGLQPYSFVGYDFQNKSVQNSTIASDTLAVTNSYSGSGNLSQLYFGLGAHPFADLHLGMNVYYTFGTLEHESKASFDNSSYHPTTQVNSISAHDWHVSFGAQYMFHLNEKNDLSWGATFELPSKMKADATREVTTTLVDTVTLNYDNSFGLPMSFGTGLVYQYTDRWLLGFDYNFQKWSDVEFFGEKSFSDRHRFSVGGQLIPQRMGKNYLKRIAYRLGLSESNSYYKVNDQDFNMFTTSVGLGFPLRKSNNPSYLNITCEYGKAGEKSDDLILEQYLKFTLNLTLNETWFVKRKFE